jgi:SAM-dependent methyltransferase
MPDLTASDASSDERRATPADPPPAPAEPGAAAGPAEPIYGARYYATYNGGAYEFEGDWANFFNGLADRIIRQLQPRTVLDAGCAKGFLVHALRERGVEAYGIDVSEYAVANAIESVRPFVRIGSMTEPLDRRYDLITCIEAIEHVEPSQVRAAVDTLCAATDVVLLSSTGDGEHYGEPSHTSMRPPEEWAALFAEHGFLRDVDIDVGWVTPWAMVLKREPALTVPQVVREYDRRLARFQRETIELRQSALRMERELEELDVRRYGSDEELRNELRKLRHEVERLRSRDERAVAALTETLRLRDLLIVSERELGHVRGEVVRLSDQLSGYDELAASHHALVNSTTWRLAWKVLGPYRRARQRIGL